jgi:hypothetical protein
MTHQINSILSITFSKFVDTCDIVRMNVQKIFSLVTTQLDGVQRILLFSLLVPLIRRIEIERHDIQILILETVYNCTRLGKVECVECTLSDLFVCLLFSLHEGSLDSKRAIRMRCTWNFHKDPKE